MRTFCNKNRVSSTLGVHQYTYTRLLYFILVVSTVHSIVKRKVTAVLQYFCHSVLWWTLSIHSCPSSAQKNWLIFNCFTSFLRQLRASHGAAICLTALISDVPACSNRRRIKLRSNGMLYSAVRCVQLCYLCSGWWCIYGKHNVCITKETILSWCKISHQLMCYSKYKPIFLKRRPYFDISFTCVQGPQIFCTGASELLRPLLFAVYLLYFVVTAEQSLLKQQNEEMFQKSTLLVMPSWMLWRTKV